MGKLGTAKKVIANKYVAYSVCFWGFIGAYIYQSSSAGWCAIGTSDAITQIYPIMVYIRRLLLSLLDALVHGGDFTFPMVDFTVGMGDDTIAALNWHGFGDPFYLLTIFCPEENLPYFYTVLFYLKVYLGGAAFIAFASNLERGKSTSAYVIGALVYCFTGFTVQSNMHTIFTHAMVYIPLMLLGAECSMHDRKKGLLCISVFCFALSGFFFLYIGSVSLAVYVVYRLIREKCHLREAVRKICGLIAEYLSGLGLSAVIFIPAILGFFQSDRVGIKTGYPLIESWDSIKRLLINMFLPSYEDSWQELSICTIGMVVLICVLLAKDRQRERRNLLLLFLAVIIPFVSCVMSGFGECYGRWELVVDMYLAFLMVSFWDELEDLTVLQKTGIVLVYLLLLFFGKKEDILTHERYGKTIIAYGAILLADLVIVPLLKRTSWGDRAGKYLLVVIVYLTICFNWKAVLRDKEIESVQFREVVKELTEDEGQEDFYRIDNERAFAEPRLAMNISLYQGYYGTMEYVSIENNSYITAFSDWDIARVNHNVLGLDQRAVLETMCAVKYFVVSSENSGIVPYGFEYVKSTSDGEWSLYENAYRLPIAYAYEKVYNGEAYQELSGIDRQQVMLQAAAAEGYAGSLPKSEEITGSTYRGTYVVEASDGIVAENGRIKTKAGAVLTLSSEIKAGCENYLFYKGELSQFPAGAVEIEDGYVKYDPSISPCLINLGTAREDKDIKINIPFNGEAEFDIEDLQIIHYDMSNYGEYIEELKKDTDGRFVVTTNHISGNVDFGQNKMLCFSVPYGKGWHAKVDGQAVEVYPLNDLFMGIEVLKGAHEIELYYITPGIRAGGAVSAGTAVVIIAISVLRIRQKKK